MSGSALCLNGVSHRFGDLEVLADLRVEVRPGEFLVLVGPSGCGKSTLLALMAGFYPPTSGRIERVGGTRTIHQQDGLFPWLTAAENIRLGLRGVKATAADQALAELLDLIELRAFADHYPHQLSGGMRQRVELARAVAGSAETLLMDEPFSALDYQARLKMRHELARLLAQRPRTVVFITHDIEEAAQLADRVLVLTERPARVRRELRITAPRPRQPTHPAVVEAVEAILQEMDLYEL
jgi:ABC-type nitrate/sulfonate/bicarbonate transport system ATPase subunit